jgi:hypothetical protein
MIRNRRKDDGQNQSCQGYEKKSEQIGGLMSRVKIQVFHINMPNIFVKNKGCEKPLDYSERGKMSEVAAIT